MKSNAVYGRAILKYIKKCKAFILAHNVSSWTLRNVFLLQHSSKRKTNMSSEELN